MTLSFQKKLIKLLHADSFFINYFTIIHAFDKTSGRINRPFPSPRFKIPLISKRIAKKTGEGQQFSRLVFSVPNEVGPLVRLRLVFVTFVNTYHVFVGNTLRQSGQSCEPAACSCARPSQRKWVSYVNVTGQNPRCCVLHGCTGSAKTGSGGVYRLRAGFVHRSRTTAFLSRRRRRRRTSKISSILFFHPFLAKVDESLPIFK